MKSQPKQPEPAEWFSARQAARLSGLKLTMVNYLCRTQIVEPTYDGATGARGHGTVRRYSFGDVVALRLIAKLSKNGVQPSRLKLAMAGLRRFHPEITLTSLPASHLVTNGKDIYLYREGEPVQRAFDGQFAFAFVIELAQLQREVVKTLRTSETTRPPLGAGRKAA